MFVVRKLFSQWSYTTKLGRTLATTLKFVRIESQAVPGQK